MRDWVGPPEIAATVPSTAGAVNRSSVMTAMRCSEKAQRLSGSRLGEAIEGELGCARPSAYSPIKSIAEEHQMPQWKSKNDLASEWKGACNSHNLDRVLAMYSEKVVFKSPRVCTVSGEAGGILRGKPAVRHYWRRIFQRRPDLEFAVGHVFAGVDSIALEYRAGDQLHGIEFMTLDADGLVSLAVGNDVVAPG
jgi:hypothetical protein